MYYEPNFTSGTATLSFDLRLGSGSTVAVEWRDAAIPYRVGPSFAIDGTGQVAAAGRRLLLVPTERWCHFKVVCKLGNDADGTWTLMVRAADQPWRVVEKLPCDPSYKALRWLGFISTATVKTVSYLDDIMLSSKTQASPPSKHED